ncbi:hypothetical protein [Niallia sp. 01092]
MSGNQQASLTEPNKKFWRRKMKMKMIVSNKQNGMKLKDLESG